MLHAVCQERQCMKVFPAAAARHSSPGLEAGGLLAWKVDVLDPAFAPGTGTPEVAGLTNRELLPAIRRLCHETPVVGMEVVEVAPLLDHSAITTMNARKAIFEALTGFAMRKKGIIEPNYMDPVASGKVPFPNLPRTLSL